MPIDPSQIPPETNIPPAGGGDEPSARTDTSSDASKTGASDALLAQKKKRELEEKLGKGNLQKMIDHVAEEIKDMIQEKLKHLVDKNPKDLEKRLEEELSKEKNKLEKDMESMVALLQGADLTKMSPQEAALMNEIAKIPPAELKTNADQIFALVQKYCDRLLVTVTGGRPSLLVDLKTEANVPRFFQGTQLTLTKTDAGLVVNFSNFSSPAQERTALFAVEQNAEALNTLRDNLEAKNINLAELNIGGRSVALPSPAAARAEAVRTPEAEEGREERGGRGGEGMAGGGGGAGEGGGPTGR